MSQLSQEKPAGNTKTAGPKYQLYAWNFTIPMEEYSASQLSQHLKGFCKKFTFQGEEGETTGYKHWQGTISLKTKEYFATVKNLLGEKAHIEATKNIIASENYCKKDSSRIEGPYNEKSVFLKTLTSLRPWQAELEKELLEEPDDRKIIWYYDKKGGAGKTQFAKYLAIKHKYDILQNGGKGDLAFALSENPHAVIFNFTRDNEERVNYDAIESVKDGMIFSKKYESRMKIFNSPHVVIFSNDEPRTTSMSADRWDIRIL